MCLFLMQGKLELEKVRGEEGESISSGVAPVSSRCYERIPGAHQISNWKCKCGAQGTDLGRASGEGLMSRRLGKGVAAVSKEQVCSETRKEPRRESLKTSTLRDRAETDDSVKGSKKQWT